MTWERGQIMKKGVIIVTIIMLVIGIFSIASKSYADDKAIDDKTESKIVEIKEETLNSLEDYKAKYGSDTYGTVAYILNIVRIYSIPVCFLGIVIGAIHQYALGIRKMDILERGMAFMVSCITLLIICQILPLAFAIFVKFGRG